MKKFYSIALVCVLTVCLLAGCRSGNSTNTSAATSTPTTTTATRPTTQPTTPSTDMTGPDMDDMLPGAEDTINPTNGANESTGATGDGTMRGY